MSSIRMDYFAWAIQNGADEELLHYIKTAPFKNIYKRWQSINKI